MSGGAVTGPGGEALKDIAEKGRAKDIQKQAQDAIAMIENMSGPQTAETQAAKEALGELATDEGSAKAAATQIAMAFKKRTNARQHSKNGSIK